MGSRALRLLGSWALGFLGSWALGHLGSCLLWLWGSWALRFLGSEALGLLGCWDVQKSLIFGILGHKKCYFVTYKKNFSRCDKILNCFFCPLKEGGSVVFLECTCKCIYIYTIYVDHIT